MKTMILSCVSLLSTFALLCAGAGDGEAGSHSTESELLDGLLKHYVVDGFSVTYTVKTSQRVTVLNGPFSVFNTNDIRIAEGNYRDSTLDGELRLWHGNGKLSCVQQYENGRLQGEVNYWDTDGKKLRTTRWVDGEKDGAEIYWDTHGKTNQCIVWNAGRLLSVELFNNGVLQKRLTDKEAEDYFRMKMREQEALTSKKQFKSN